MLGVFGMKKETEIQIKIALEFIHDEVERLTKFNDEDIFEVMNSTLDTSNPAPGFPEVAQNEFLLDLIQLSRTE